MTNLTEQLKERMDATVDAATARWLAEKFESMEKAHAGARYTMNHLAADYVATNKKITEQVEMLNFASVRISKLEDIIAEMMTRIDNMAKAFKNGD